MIHDTSLVYSTESDCLLLSALTCSVLPQPDNGQIVYSMISLPAFGLGTTATYSCNIGYGLSGTQMTRTCQSDALSLSGEWSGQALTCIGEISILMMLYLHKYI